MRNRPIKIAIYSGEIPSTTFIERLIDGLAEDGCRILLFGVQKKKIRYLNYVTVVSYTHHRILKFLHYLKYSLLLFLFKHQDKRKLDRLLRQRSKKSLYSKVKFYPVLWHHPDIFHLQWAKGLEDWSWVQEFGIKLVLSLRGAHINYSPIADPGLATMYRRYFPKVDGFHAVSKAIAKEAQHYGAAADKLQVVYSGLQLDDFKKTAHEHNDVFHIVSVGRPHWIKGYTYALDACRLLKEQNFKLKYDIVGGSSDIELLYQIHDLGLQDEVTLLDQTSFEDVTSLICCADLLLLSSTKEGIANVVLEAMALETIVLSTDCGGINEVIVDGKNGFLTPVRDSKKMADKIIQASKLSEKEKVYITTNALSTIHSHHTKRQMVEGMVALYRRVIND